MSTPVGVEYFSPRCRTQFARIEPLPGFVSNRPVSPGSVFAAGAAQTQPGAIAAEPLPGFGPIPFCTSGKEI